MTCATIAGCDDYDEIAAWGDDHLDFLKGYSEYFFGTPKEDWLRVVINRIDPALFEACFTSWGDCQKFRVRAGIMGKKEPQYVPTQRAYDTPMGFWTSCLPAVPPVRHLTREACWIS